MHPHLLQILHFLRGIGLEYRLEPVMLPCFLPGLRLDKGCLVIDVAQLRAEGDILHEAGHLAVMPPRIRHHMTGDLRSDPVHQGGELAAIAWSYAACCYLGIDPLVVFHPEGYGGGGAHLASQFSSGRYLGVSLLQWQEMAYEPAVALARHQPAFPQMIHWLCQVDRYA